jgi:hypothetical protein
MFGRLIVVVNTAWLNIPQRAMPGGRRVEEIQQARADMLIVDIDRREHGRYGLSRTIVRDL